MSPILWHPLRRNADAVMGAAAGGGGGGGGGEAAGIGAGAAATSAAASPTPFTLPVLLAIVVVGAAIPALGFGVLLLKLSRRRARRRLGVLAAVSAANNVNDLDISSTVSSSSATIHEGGRRKKLQKPRPLSKAGRSMLTASSIGSFGTLAVGGTIAEEEGEGATGLPGVGARGQGRQGLGEEDTEERGEEEERARAAALVGSPVRSTPLPVLPPVRVTRRLSFNPSFIWGLGNSSSSSNTGRSGSSSGSGSRRSGTIAASGEPGAAANRGSKRKSNAAWIDEDALHGPKVSPTKGVLRKASKRRSIRESWPLRNMVPTLPRLPQPGGQGQNSPSRRGMPLAGEVLREEDEGATPAALEQGKGVAPLTAQTRTSSGSNNNNNNIKGNAVYASADSQRHKSSLNLSPVRSGLPPQPSSSPLSQGRQVSAKFARDGGGGLRQPSGESTLSEILRSTEKRLQEGGTTGVATRNRLAAAAASHMLSASASASSSPMKMTVSPGGAERDETTARSPQSAHSGSDVHASRTPSPAKSNAATSASRSARSSRHTLPSSATSEAAPTTALTSPSRASSSMMMREEFERMQHQQMQQMNLELQQQQQPQQQQKKLQQYQSHGRAESNGSSSSSLSTLYSEDERPIEDEGTTLVTLPTSYTGSTFSSSVAARKGGGGPPTVMLTASNGVGGSNASFGTFGSRLQQMPPMAGRGGLQSPLNGRATETGSSSGLSPSTVAPDVVVTSPSSVGSNMAALRGPVVPPAIRLPPPAADKAAMARRMNMAAPRERPDLRSMSSSPTLGRQLESSRRAGEMAIVADYLEEEDEEDEANAPPSPTPNRARARANAPAGPPRMNSTSSSVYSQETARGAHSPTLATTSSFAGAAAAAETAGAGEFNKTAFHLNSLIDSPNSFLIQQQQKQEQQQQQQQRNAPPRPPPTQGLLELMANLRRMNSAISTTSTFYSSAAGGGGGGGGGGNALTGDGRDSPKLTEMRGGGFGPSHKRGGSRNYLSFGTTPPKTSSTAGGAGAGAGAGMGAGMPESTSGRQRAGTVLSQQKHVIQPNVILVSPERRGGVMTLKMPTLVMDDDDDDDDERRGKGATDAAAAAAGAAVGTTTQGSGALREGGGWGNAQATASPTLASRKLLHHLQPQQQQQPGSRAGPGRHHDGRMMTGAGAGSVGGRGEENASGVGGCGGDNVRHSNDSLGLYDGDGFLINTPGRDSVSTFRFSTLRIR